VKSEGVGARVSVDVRWSGRGRGNYRATAGRRKRRRGCKLLFSYFSNPTRRYAVTVRQHTKRTRAWLSE
jgi:hypothetical protein